MESPRFFITLALPDGRTWRVDDASDRWLVATHLSSRSMLWVRSWREGSVMSHGRCEAVARRWRPDLLGADATTLVDRRPLGAPIGFDTEMGFAVYRAKSALGGVVAAFGAHVRLCLVMAYATRSEGPDAERVLAERLAFIAERVFPRVRSRTIEDRVAPLGGR